MRLDPNPFVIGSRDLSSTFFNTDSSVLDLISCRILDREANRLHKLREKATWKQILENEQDAKAVEDIIQRVDEALLTFQVCRHSSQRYRVL
jgi:hypothetical protein